MADNEQQIVCNNPSPTHGGMGCKLHIEAYAPCPFHESYQDENGIWHHCDCPKVSIGVRENDADITTNQFAQFVICNILLLSQTIKAISGSTFAQGGATPVTVTAVQVQAGTGSTGPYTADYALGAAVDSAAAATAQTFTAATGTATTVSETVTATVTAGANRAYTEVGLYVVTSSGTFMICRDVFSVLNVSNTGTLSVTYTFTFT